MQATFGDAVELDGTLGVSTLAGAVKVFVPVTGLPGGEIDGSNLFIESEQLRFVRNASGPPVSTVQLHEGLWLTGTASLEVDEGGLTIDIPSSELIFAPDFSASSSVLGMRFTSTVRNLRPDIQLIAFRSNSLHEGLADMVVDRAPGQAPLIIGSTQDSFGGGVKVFGQNMVTTDLQDTEVEVMVQADWIDTVTDRGDVVLIAKVADDGELFVEIASCEASGSRHLCTAKFVNEAAGFSEFVLISGSPVMISSAPTEPSPVLPTATLAGRPVATSTPTAVPTRAVVNPEPTQAPLPSPTPAWLDFDRRSVDLSVWGWLIVGVLIIIIASGVWSAVAQLRKLYSR